MTIPARALGLLLACAAAGTAAGQHAPQRTVPKPIDFATSQNDNLFSLVRSQDDIHSIEKALEELASGNHDPAIRRLHELLRIDPHGVIPVAPGRYLGIRNAVVTVLANASPAARDAYEQLARREAADLFSRPCAELPDEELVALATRFPTSNQGLAACMLLGDRALERGDGLQAAQHFRYALDATPIGSREEQRCVERLACAEALSEPDNCRARTGTGTEPAERSRLVGDLLTRMRPTARRVPALGGGRSGAMPMDDVVGTPRGFLSEKVLAPGFDRREKGELALHAVGDLDRIFVNNGRELLAFDPLRKSLEWASVSPLRDFGSGAWEQSSRSGRNGRMRRRRMRSPFDSINQDMVLSAAVAQGTVIAPLQVPDDSQNVDFQASFRIMTKIPQRRLFAFDRRTGALQWAHFDELDGPLTRRYRGHDACAPPVIAGDTVYAPVVDRSGAIAFSIAAYDVATGKPRWRRLVCSSQQDVNMFGNARMEFAASPLALHGGVLYGATNLGVAYAVEAQTGRVRWITAYDVVRMPRAMLHGQADRQVYFANNAPVVRDGVVCMTPLDSQFVLGLDVDSGERLWEMPYDARINGVENRVLWLCGAIGDEFVLSGAGVVAVTARPDGLLAGRAQYRQLIRPDQLGDHRRTRMPARPAITAEHVWIPSDDRLLAFDHEGMAHPQMPFVRVDGYQPGNLMLVDGAIASVRNHSFDVILDATALLDRSEAQMRNSPGDPEAMLRLATLQRSLIGDAASPESLAAIQTLYERALQACIDRGLPPEHPTRRALQDELYHSAHAAAEAAADNDHPDARGYYARARDLAPDDARWIEEHIEVLKRSRGDRSLFLAELDRLLQRAPAGRVPAPLSLPVTTFVLWQRAIGNENRPTDAVALWQQLLEQHGQHEINGEPAASAAEREIARLIGQHGDEVYTAIAERADEALRMAGSDDMALTEVTRRYPNSKAAQRAGARLLDRAVRRGDLGVASRVLARSIRNDVVEPGQLRRVQVAAVKRGNLPLAVAMARLLDAHPDDDSDWPDDGGSSFAAAGRSAVADVSEPTEVLPQLPSHDALQIPPRSPQDYVRMLPNDIGRGFRRPDDAPVFLNAGTELLALDMREGRELEQLFALDVEYVERVILCGETLVVRDMYRSFAVHYRTGEPQWEIEFGERIAETLGVTSGVLHMLVPPDTPTGDSELLGIEPISGTRLFQRQVSERLKAGDHELLMMSMGDDRVVERIDPITGHTRARIPYRKAMGPGALQIDENSLTRQLYGQRVFADGERVYLPVDGRNENARPQLIALAPTGEIAWRWQGTVGQELLLAQLHGDRVVVCEASESRNGSLVVLDAATGNAERTVDLGAEPVVLNWKPSWLHNPLPTRLAFGSHVDRQSRNRQFVCVSLDDGPSFALPLASDDGDILETPRFGDDFVTFGVKPRNANGAFRLYAIDTASRKAKFQSGLKFRSVVSRSNPHGMLPAGAYTVLSTTQGLILLGDEQKGSR